MIFNRTTVQTNPEGEEYPEDGWNCLIWQPTAGMYAVSSAAASPSTGTPNWSFLFCMRVRYR